MPSSSFNSTGRGYAGIGRPGRDVPFLKSIQVCVEGGYHLKVSPKLGGPTGADPVKVVANPPLTKYGWPRHVYDWQGVVGEEKACTWKCNNRRHAGPCQQRAGAILFRRIQAGLARLPTDELVLMVLTLKHREWTTPEDAYLALFPLWRNFIKMLKVRWGDLVPVFDEKTGLQKLGPRRIVGERMILGPDGRPVVHTGRGRYHGFVKTEPIIERRPRFDRLRPKALTVVEKHPRSGYPHLNVVLLCSELARQLGPHRVVERETPSGRKERRREPTTALGKRTLRELKRLAVKSGFGWALSASPVESVDAVAGYIVKTAKGGGLSTTEGGDVSGELAKPSQVADNAPVHFRAVRSTPGMLQPMREEGAAVGRMVFAPAPKPKKSSYLLVRHWFQLGLDLRAREPEQLALGLAA